MVRLVSLIAGLGLALVAIMSLDGGNNAAVRNGLIPTDDINSSGENIALVAPPETNHALPPTIRRLADSPATGPLRPTVMGIAQPLPDVVPVALTADTPSFGDYRRVNAVRANVRGGPSKGYEVIGRVNQGEEVEIISGPEDGWLQIRIQGDGIEGWVAASLIGE